MIWHIVRFDFSGVDEDVRRDLEGALDGLRSMEEAAFLRLGRELADPAVTGLITGFATVDDLETYRTHPDHLPVVEQVRAAGVALTRLDIETEDDVTELPA